jgi:hypothetical protein
MHRRRVHTGCVIIGGHRCSARARPVLGRCDLGVEISVRPGSAIAALASKIINKQRLQHQCSTWLHHRETCMDFYMNPQIDRTPRALYVGHCWHSRRAPVALQATGFAHARWPRLRRVFVAAEVVVVRVSEIRIVR